MPNAAANRSDLRYIAEVTWGTTPPTTPAFKHLRMTGESLNAGIQTAVSEEIRSDRNQQDLMKVGSNAGGNVEFELSAESYDDWLEALMCTTWATDVLVNGVTEKSFSVLKRLIDVTQYFLFTGVRVNTMSLAIAPNAVVTGSFGCLAKQSTRAGSAPVGSTFPASPTTTPMNGAAGVTVNTVDGAAITGGLMNMTLNVSNNRRAQDVIGSDAPQDIVAGKFEVSGDFEVYFADGTLYDKFLAMTSSAIQVKMVTPGDTSSLQFDVPNAKFETAEVVAQGTDTDVMLKTTYRGLYDSVTLGTLKITRTT